MIDYNPTLSLCMIVKNEEKHLSACLESVKNYVDEIIIVDTGSTDRTVEIAERFDAKVYFHPWENSFSKARNLSIKYATCDWIIFLDADEEIEKDDAHKLKESIKDKDADILFLQLSSKTCDGEIIPVAGMARMFKNHIGIHFKGIVHEMLFHDDDTFKSRKKIANVRMYHYGYDQNEEEMEGKFVRDSTLLKEQIHNEPQKPLSHQYLAVCYLKKNKYDECLASALEAVRLYELHNSSSQYRVLAYNIASIAFYNKKDMANAEKYALKALDICPDYLDAYETLSSIYFQLNRNDKFLNATNKFLELLDSIKLAPSTVTDTPYVSFKNEWRAHVRLAINYFLHDNENDGIRSLNEAVNSADKKWMPYLAIGKYFVEQNKLELAEKFLDDGLKCDFANKDYRYGIVELYEKSMMADKALLCLKKILENHPDDIAHQFHQGIVFLNNNQYREAINRFKSIIGKDPGHIDALFHLGMTYERNSDNVGAKEIYNKILEIRLDNPETLIRLGSLYLSEPDYVNAEVCFLSILKLNKYLLEAHIALSRIYVSLKDITGCVKSCNELLKCLKLPENLTIDSISDLANIYINIGTVLKEQKQELLSRLSFEIANELDPTLF